MSGPKGYGYSVVSQAELLRREALEREARCAQLSTTLTALLGQLRHLGISRQQPMEPTGENSENMVAWETALTTAIAESGQLLEEANARAAVARLQAMRTVVDVSNLSLGITGIALAPTPAAPEQDDEFRAVAADVDKVMAVAGRLRDDDDRESLTTLASTVLGTTHLAQAKGDLLTLKTRTTEAVRRQESRSRAAEAVLAVAAIRSSRAHALRARAATVMNADDVRQLEADVEAVVAESARAASAAYVQQALSDVLDELGFELDEDFEVTDYGAVAVADHPEHPGFGVRLQVNPASGMLLTRVVADDTQDAAAAARAEAETCQKVQAVAAGLAQHGITTELRNHREPGTQPVDQRPARRSTSAGRQRRRSRQQAQEQSR